MFMLILGIVFLVSAIICHAVARRRAANPVFWGVMGLVFGPLAIPFVLMAGTRQGGNQA